VIDITISMPAHGSRPWRAATMGAPPCVDEFISAFVVVPPTS